MESSSGNETSQLDFSKIDINILNVENNSSEKNIYIFFSFDLVGSTKFKVEEPSSWPFIIFKFYEFIYNELKNKIPQILVWKYLGDEVLLYVSIQDFESDAMIYEIPNLVFTIQSKVATDIQTLINNKKLNLDIKSTIWIAGVKNVKSQVFNPNDISVIDSNYQNLKMSLTVGNQLQVDFLGPDMDTGFRVAKFAYHHKVVLSADFAYLLYRMKKPKKQKGIDDCIKIVSFEILKGVWNNKYYPIIWYYPNWKCIEKDFLYADHKENEIVDRILSNRIESINRLENVYEELGKLEYIDGFVEECIAINSSSEKEAFVISNESK